MEKGIKSIEELRGMLEESKRIECYIALQGGARSGKIIQLDCVRDGVPVYEVFNEIDDVEQLLKEPDLWTLSNIGEALDKGALYLY
jgi:hypothetical protein